MDHITSLEEELTAVYANEEQEGQEGQDDEEEEQEDEEDEKEAEDVTDTKQDEVLDDLAEDTKPHVD
jgi:hypothetical protein